MGRAPTKLAIGQQYGYIFLRTISRREAKVEGPRPVQCGSSISTNGLPAVKQFTVISD